MKKKYDRYYESLRQAIIKLQKKRNLTAEERDRLEKLCAEEEEEDLAQLGFIELGMRVTDCRVARNLTLQELAEKTELTVGKLKKLEERTADASVWVLKVVSDFFDIGIEELHAGIVIGYQKRVQPPPKRKLARPARNT